VTYARYLQRMLDGGRNARQNEGDTWIQMRVRCCNR
jgi:hypothetical protein